MSGAENRRAPGGQGELGGGGVHKEGNERAGDGSSGKGEVWGVLRIYT